LVTDIDRRFAETREEDPRMTDGFTSSIHLFEYQPEKIKIGTVYHYVKSNIDGTNPADVSIYVASRQRVEVLKIEQGSTLPAYVTADFDWESFSAVRLDSWHIIEDGSLRRQLESHLSRENNTYTAYLEGGIFSADVGHYPLHNYNFDFISFNFIFRHLIDPEQKFAIGVVEPNWDVILSPDFSPTGEATDVLRYKGKALIEFLGADTYRDVDCRKYRISGEGMDEQVGFFWANIEHGHFENFEHPHPDNPAWDSFKFDLRSIEYMTLAEWKEFIAARHKEMLERNGSD
jgi:hypothetical protein|tara:strand:+ start:4116 stop:4982 length:867 start_codon:yes stop_codon:yes gene_type:complete